MAGTDRHRARLGVVQVALLALVLGLLGGGAGPAAAEEQPGPVAAREAPVPPPGRQVLVISVDGLGSVGVRRIGLRGLPGLRLMRRQGASTLEARTAYELTFTLPNHAGMMTGRRIKGRRGHGVTVNSDPGGTVHDLAGRYVPSLFDVVHDHGGSTALFTSKDKFALFDRSWSHGAPDAVGADDGADKIDRYVYRAAQRRLVSKTIRRLGRGRAGATFLHLARPDVVGHRDGYLSPAYEDAVRDTDRQVRRILDAVAADPLLAEGTTVVLTADHGGKGHEHRDPAAAVNYRVPLFVWGAGVEPGGDLYALNPERTDPGRGRPAYRDPPPVRNLDAAGLVTSLLGLPRVRGGRLPGTTPLEVS